MWKAMTREARAARAKFTRQISDAEINALEARRAAVIVVDTNVICYRWMSSPNSAAAETALAKDPHWIAPLLWRSEFRNIVGSSDQKRRHSQSMPRRKSCERRRQVSKQRVCRFV